MNDAHGYKLDRRQGPVIIDLRGFDPAWDDFPVTMQDLQELAANPAFLSLWQSGMKKLTAVHDAIRGQLREGSERVVLARLNALEEVLGSLQVFYENGLPEKVHDTPSRTQARQRVTEHLEETFPWLKKK